MRNYSFQGDLFKGKNNFGKLNYFLLKILNLGYMTLLNIYQNIADNIHDNIVLHRQ